MVADWNEMLAYVGFTRVDAVRLRALLPAVEPALPWLIDRFYRAIQANEGTRAILVDEAQILRLKKTLAQWVRELLSGPHDEAYYQRRQRIGRVHVRVGLPERYVFTAMNLLRRDLVDLASASLPWGEALPTIHSLGRITDLELAVMSATFHEAHEDRELSTLQEMIVGSLPVTVVCLDADQQVTAATRPGRGMVSRGGALGEHYSEHLPAGLGDVIDLSSLITQAMRTGRSVAVPRAVLGSSSKARHMRVGIVPLQHERVRILIHVEDLTDAVRAEMRMQQAEGLARLGGLAASVAHEIRNPLTAISTTLQVITRSLHVDDPRREVLGKVQKQVHRLDALVTDLLRYARPPRPQVRELDLAQLCRNEMAGHLARIVLEASEPSVGRADPQMLQQILINLVQNARDAAGPEGRVTLRVGPGPMLQVIDDGVGIADEVIDTLFEPFVTTKARGTGLGLAICRKLCESMSASLRLMPTSRGACFQVVLPPASMDE